MLLDSFFFFLFFPGRIAPLFAAGGSKFGEEYVRIDPADFPATLVPPEMLRDAQRLAARIAAPRRLAATSPISAAGSHGTSDFPCF